MARLNRSLLIRWILGIAIVTYLLTLIDFREFAQVLSKAHWGFVLLACVLVFIDRCWMGFKWQILLKAQGLGVSVSECIRVYFVSSFVGLVLPSSVGGDLVRLFSLSVPKGEREKVAASLVVEKLLSMMALLLLVMFCILLLVMHSAVAQWKYFLIALGVFIGLGLGMIVSFLYVPVERFKNTKNPLFQKIAKVVLAYQEFRNYRKAMAIFFVISFFEQFMPFIFNYTLVKGFDLPGGALTYFMIVPMVYMIARLPISVDGLGVLETLYVVLFPLVGLNKTQALLLALASRIVTTVSHLLGGVFYFWKKPKIDNILNTNDLEKST